MQEGVRTARIRASGRVRYYLFGDAAAALRDNSSSESRSFNVTSADTWVLLLVLLERREEEEFVLHYGTTERRCPRTLLVIIADGQGSGSWAAILVVLVNPGSS